ncbi:GNAT family N-acetyltransferase [Chitinophaga nivalis]|uniref:GNAT family N-acetyltransferase n=1 Tax=Chitinophaga nivalis TaxID=2991709 RepID=A0ABT3ISQ4_9BACT|nr:GNAT family N-acetyltransferase [Chitinophaga nivalis]MCW3463305.1 GNAT family N-acetyltransferase [Chitinophaga nivalis]MCW3487005.1 GNAT family N-acetyltransferase [Chitinophaga nivalis]
MIFLHDFHNLDNISTEAICHTFNAAFSDYVVPLHLTPSILEQKMKGENLQRHFSVGAFHGNELGAFMLHGADQDENPTVLYNGGTGVVPAYRGQHLIQKMYDQFIPLYKAQGIRKIILEVISTNLPAIKAYTNSGFHKIRTFRCYKGTVQVQKTAADISIKENNTPDWALLAAFTDMAPSWSNSYQSIQRELAFTHTWEAYTAAGALAGYISVNRDSRRIRSIAVHPDHRRKGIASTLLQHAATALNGPMSIINIDEHHPEIGTFLESAGLAFYLTQYEMVAEI